jgi:hypothetical protein
MKTSTLFVVRRSCSKIYGYQRSVQYRRLLKKRLWDKPSVVQERPISSTRTKSTWPRLRYRLIIALALCLVCPAIAEPPDHKPDNKPEGKKDDRFPAEANLPIYHVPLKAIRANSVGKSRSETKLLPLRQPQFGSPRLATAPFRSKTAETEIGMGKSALPAVSNERSLSKLDSLAQTQDKTRQRALYGFKPNDSHPSSLLPVISAESKGSVAKPVVVAAPQIAINKAPVLPINATILVKSESVPHRGPAPGPASLGGPATTKHTGLNGAEMKLRP